MNLASAALHGFSGTKRMRVQRNDEDWEGDDKGRVKGGEKSSGGRRLEWKAARDEGFIPESDQKLVRAKVAGRLTLVSSPPSPLHRDPSFLFSPHGPFCNTLTSLIG